MAGRIETWARDARPPCPGGVCAVLLAAFGAALARRAQRRRLEGLEPRLLRDIGITREEALAEARKPMWRR